MTQQRVSPISVTSVLPAVPVLSLQAALGQSANIQEWRNSSGTAVSRISADASAFTTNQLNTRYLTDSGGTTPYIELISNKLFVISRNASYVGLTVDGVASQTADLQQWRNSAGTVLTYVDSAGRFIANSLGVGGSPVNIAYTYLTTTSTVVALAVRGGASQSADLQQWQNSAGTVLCRIDSAGRSIFDSLGVQGSPSGIAYAYFGNAATTTKNVVVRAIASQTANMQEWQNSDGTVTVRINQFGELQTSAGYSTSFGTSSNYTASVNVLPPSTTTAGIIVRGRASQTADLQQWQNSAGSVLAYITASGVIVNENEVYLNNSGTGSTGLQVKRRFTSLGTNATDINVVVKGATSQTADLQQWQDSAGTVLAKVQSNGLVYSGTAVGAPYISDGGSTRPYIDFTVANRLIVNARAASYVALTVDGVASQTGNLTEWRNNSGTILAGVQANGQVFGTLKTNNAYVFIQEQNSGGSTVYTRQTATPAAPGANAANLYFRDGTNAGTLKLVVRAGTGGAETTILDNIPTT